MVESPNIHFFEPTHNEPKDTSDINLHTPKVPLPLILEGNLLVAGSSDDDEETLLDLEVEMDAETDCCCRSRLPLYQANVL
jgi:hypothetical protein